MRRALLLAAVVLASAPGCQRPGPRPAPSQELERLVFFSERDERGHEHEISARPAVGQDERPSPEAAEPPVASLADGATVDVDSRLRIDLRASSLQGELDDATLTQLQDSAQALDQGLGQIAAYLEVQARATDAWTRYESLDEDQRDGSPEEQAFIEARRARAGLELSFLEPIRALWPRQSPELAEPRAQAEALVDRLESGEDTAGVVQGMNTLLQQRLEQWNRDAEKLQRETERQLEKRRLRIEAFLLPSGTGRLPQAVHVPGYDDLDQGQVQRIDPYGLQLTELERKRLTELMAASRELAGTLERVRTGQDSWQEAFGQVQSEILQRFASLARLAEQLDADALAQRADATRAKLETFIDTLRHDLPALAEAHAATWKDELTQALEQRDELVELADLVRELAGLEQRWRVLDPADLDALLVDSAAAAERIVDLLDSGELASQVQALQEVLQKLLDQQLGELADDAQAEVLQAAQPLLDDLAQWRTLGQGLRDGLEVLQRFLGLGGTPPVHLELDASASFSVSLDTAPNTQVDLQRTRRLPGDRLLVRARLVDGQDKDVAEPLEASFELAKLGWHADYVPAVVYVTADQNAGATDSGGFSASLAWQWSYGARDDEDDPYLSRLLGWSAGLHAALLAFAPDNDPEVGLGLTLGLWQNRLIFGAGYNLFAESNDDGRYYYYIGSSLIPLLQALQGSD